MTDHGGLTPEKVRLYRHLKAADDRRIWTVYNGWMGNGPTAAIVEAPDEAAAIEAAIPVLRDSPDGQHHGERFYERERLRPELLEIPCITEIG